MCPSISELVGRSALGPERQDAWGKLKQQSGPACQHIDGAADWLRHFFSDPHRRRPEPSLCFGQVKGVCAGSRNGEARAACASNICYLSVSVVIDILSPSVKGIVHIEISWSLTPHACSEPSWAELRVIIVQCDKLDINWLNDFFVVPARYRVKLQT